MCDCKVGWVRNPAIEGTHNVKPVTCGEYIEALEDALRDADRAADSAELDRIQRTFGILEPPQQESLWPSV